jgi:hypothetical protein
VTAFFPWEKQSEFLAIQSTAHLSYQSHLGGYDGANELTTGRSETVSIVGF